MVLAVAGRPEGSRRPVGLEGDASFDIDHPVLSEHTPFPFGGGVDRDVARWRTATCAFDVRQRLEEAVLCADGAVLLLKGHCRELGAFGFDGFAYLGGVDVGHWCDSFRLDLIRDS